MSETEVVVKEAVVRYSIINEVTTNNELYKNISPKKILDLVLKVMTLVEKYNKNEDNNLFTGEEKKKLCYEIIKDIIKKSEIPQERKELTLNIFEYVFESFVENMISTSKDGTLLNKIPVSDKPSFLSKLIFLIKKAISIFVFKSV